MRADFLDAHHRHWEDAEYLFNAQRWANADHLYGMAAECGLKRLMLAFGMPFDQVKDRPSDRYDREHADKIWLRFETYRSGHLNGANYTLPTSNPFEHWSAGQRYSAQSCFNEVYAKHHREGASQVRQLVRKAILEGLL